MTFSAKFTVQEVGDGPSPVDVLAVAEGDTITSNTEGKIQSIEMRLVLDADETALAEGDTFVVNGHFQGSR